MVFIAGRVFRRPVRTAMQDFWDKKLFINDNRDFRFSQGLLHVIQSDSSFGRVSW